MQKKLVSFLLIISLVLTAFAGAFAESGSAAPAAGKAKENVSDSSSGSAPAEDPTEYVPKIVKDHPGAYKKAELTALDKADGTVAVYETDDDKLPDIDVYVFSKEGINLKDFADLHAETCHSKAIQPKKDKEVYFFYDTEEYNGKLYYVLVRISEVDADRFGEISYYYKTVDIPFGNSGLVVSIPNSFKKGELSDAMKKFGYTDYYDYSDVVKDGTELSSTLKAILVGTVKLENGKTFDDYLAEQVKEGNGIEATSIARQKFARLLSYDSRLVKDGVAITYLCEKDGQINKLRLIFSGAPSGLDAKVVSTLGKAE